MKSISKNLMNIELLKNIIIIFMKWRLKIRILKTASSKKKKNYKYLI